MKFSDTRDQRFDLEGFTGQMDSTGLDAGEIEDVGEHLLQQAAG